VFLALVIEQLALDRELHAAIARALRAD